MTHRLNHRYLPIIMALTLVFASCAPKRKPAFFHEMPSPGGVPWLSKAFDNAESKFTFGIVTDLNGGEREGIFEIAVE